MATTVCFDGTYEGLLSVIRSSWRLETVQVCQVRVEWYAYDERIQWDTWIVLVDGKPVGFTDGRPRR